MQRALRELSVEAELDVDGDDDVEYDSDAWSPPPTPPSGRPDFVPELNFEGVALDPDEGDEGEEEEWEEEGEEEERGEEGDNKDENLAAYDYFAQLDEENDADDTENLFGGHVGSNREDM